MADGGAVLDQVNIISSDLRRSLDFYRRLGAPFPRPLENPAGELFHASSESEGGAQLELDSPNFAPVWNAGWARRADLAGRIVLGFRLATREAVDERFDRLTCAGYRALQPPFDAFGGRVTRLSKTRWDCRRPHEPDRSHASNAASGRMDRLTLRLRDRQPPYRHPAASRCRGLIASARATVPLRAPH